MLEMSGNFYTRSNIKNSIFYPSLTLCLFVILAYILCAFNPQELKYFILCKAVHSFCPHNASIHAFKELNSILYFILQSLTISENMLHAYTHPKN